MLKALTTALLCMVSASVAAQPPASGPPPTKPSLAACKFDKSNAPCRGEIGVFVITNTIRNIAQAKVDETNQKLAAQGKSSRASIESLQQWKPSRFATDFADRPNSFFERVPYILTIKVDIPVTSDRHIGIPIDANVFCENWQTPSGQIVVHAQPGPASFEGGNILEDVFNVGNYIDGQVRASFSAPSAMSVDIPNSTCAAIDGSDQGTQNTNDDIITWTVPRRIHLPPTALLTSVEVTFDRLKRLPARSLGGGVLYADVENIALNAYANTDGRQKLLTMREGDDAALGLPAIRFSAGTYDQLVVIGNVDQPPNNPKDSGFDVFARADKFGPGTHVLQIPKWYSRLDPITHKPLWISVPAYEMSYTVRYLEPTTGVLEEATSSVNQPKVVKPLGGKILIKRQP